MGWGTSLHLVRGRYAILVYNARGKHVELFQTEVREFISILENEAKAYCKWQEKENPGERYHYFVIDREKISGGTNSFSE